MEQNFIAAWAAAREKAEMREQKEKILGKLGITRD